jgi:hypothetical protein
MFSKPSQRRGCVECSIDGVGLGEDPSYQGQSKTGQLISQGAGMYAHLMNPLLSIPGVSKIVGNINPLAMALAPMTGGLTLIPGFSKILGGLFKKATHFGDCMKWFNNENNIRGMVAGITPYGIDVEESFPVASREYRLQHADSIATHPGVISALNVGTRQGRIANLFVSALRSNPELMQLQCAVQARSKGEDTGVDMSQNEVGQYWGQLKEGTRQQEYVDTIGMLMNILASYQVVATKKIEVIQKTREAGLVTGSNKAFQLPEGVTSISKGGALVLDPSKNTNLVLDYGVIRKK